MIGDAVSRLMDGTLIAEALQAADVECDQVRVGRVGVTASCVCVSQQQGATDFLFDLLQPSLKVGSGSARHNWGALRLPLEQALDPRRFQYCLFVVAYS